MKTNSDNCDLPKKIVLTNPLGLESQGFWESKSVILSTSLPLQSNLEKTD